MAPQLDWGVFPTFVVKRQRRQKRQKVLQNNAKSTMYTVIVLTKMITYKFYGNISERAKAQK